MSIGPRNDLGSLAKIISTNLRKRMLERKVGNKELAEKTGVKPLHISFVLNNRRFPSWGLIVRMANFLDCKVGDIVSERDESAVNMGQVVSSLKSLMGK